MVDIIREAEDRLVGERSGLGCQTGTVVDVGCGRGILAQAGAVAGDVLSHLWTRRMATAVAHIGSGAEEVWH